MQINRASEREIVLTRTFAGSRQVVFDSLTQTKHIVRWMTPANMVLVTCEVDLRAGGAFRYGFQRTGGGAKIEVRGSYVAVEAPRLFAYTETYDFSPLQVEVVTTLDEAGGEAVFKQTLAYPSKQERDEDFDGVAASAREVYDNLERYVRAGQKA